MENNISQRQIPPRPPIKPQIEDRSTENIAHTRVQETEGVAKEKKKEKFVLHSQTKAFILLFASAVCVIFAIILFIFLIK